MKHALHLLLISLIIGGFTRMYAQSLPEKPDRRGDPRELLLPPHRHDGDSRLADKRRHHDRDLPDAARLQHLPPRLQELVGRGRPHDKGEPLAREQRGKPAIGGKPQELTQTLTSSHAQHLLESQASCDSAAVEWTANYASGLVSPDDYGKAAAIDSLGNVFVTGTSDEDYLTIKYDSSGAQQWVARYNGPGNFYDRANAIALDGSGNVYVTGESFGSGTSFDYATVKYNSAGVEQWVARYNGPGNGWDYATAIALDGSGNVYVTGESLGSGTSFDYATVKYNSAGV
ncbi:MAG: SBBP repeat-containing protein, partial [Bacteroidota bacterium]|nr:SBBP repeat-containing protein [Bacteroidota bacterium]